MPSLNEDAVPRLAAGVRARHDEVRGRWVILAPERLFVPDEVAFEIIKLCDGTRTVAAITDDLATRYDAPREIILTDVKNLLDDLEKRGVIAS